MKEANIRKIWEEFIEEYKNYLLTDEDKWLAILDKLKEFIFNNGKTPSKSNKKEKILAFWLLNQKTNYIKKEEIMKEENIRKIWEEFIEEYKKYLLTNEDKWLVDLDKLKEFIFNNGKHPSYSSNNNEENIIALWLLNQIKNYNKKEEIMKKENIRKIWEDFIIKYKNHSLPYKNNWVLYFNKY
jgi:uncharacterized protein YpuA (DUF1002 family)